MSRSRRQFLREMLGFVVVTGLPWPSIPKEDRFRIRLLIRENYGIKEIWGAGVEKVIWRDPRHLDIQLQDIQCTRPFSAEGIRVISPSLAKFLNRFPIPEKDREMAFAPKFLGPICLNTGDKLKITNHLETDPAVIRAMIAEMEWRVEDQDP